MKDNIVFIKKKNFKSTLLIWIFKKNNQKRKNTEATFLSRPSPTDTQVLYLWKTQLSWSPFFSWVISFLAHTDSLCFPLSKTKLKLALDRPLSLPLGLSLRRPNSVYLRRRVTPSLRCGSSERRREILRLGFDKIKWMFSLWKIFEHGFCSFCLISGTYRCLGFLVYNLLLLVSVAHHSNL